MNHEVIECTAGRTRDIPEFLCSCGVRLSILMPPDGDAMKFHQAYQEGVEMSETVYLRNEIGMPVKDVVRFTYDSVMIWRGRRWRVIANISAGGQRLLHLSSGDGEQLWELEFSDGMVTNFRDLL